MKRQSVRMIDPPDGSKYGFPKVLDAREGQSIDDWLRENGYPQEEIARWPGGVPCRVWLSE